MSEQRKRELTKEESDLLKAQTRNENISTWWQGFRLIFIIGALGALALCGVIICVILANPPR